MEKNMKKGPQTGTFTLYISLTTREGLLRSAGYRLMSTALKFHLFHFISFIQRSVKYPV